MDMRPPAAQQEAKRDGDLRHNTLPLFELARVLVRLDHVARRVVNDGSRPRKKSWLDIASRPAH
jgi:hypothetical protein